MFDLNDLESMLHEHIGLPIDHLLDEVYQHGLEFSGKSSYDDDATLEELRNWAVDRLLKFKEIFLPIITQEVESFTDNIA